jgi:hypothetical protein
VFRRDSGQLSERRGGRGFPAGDGARGKRAAVPLPFPSLQNRRSASALRFGGFELMYGFAAHLIAMSVVNQPDAVAEGRIADLFVSARHR